MKFNKNKYTSLVGSGIKSTSNTNGRSDFPIIATDDIAYNDEIRLDEYLDSIKKEEGKEAGSKTILLPPDNIFPDPLLLSTDLSVAPSEDSSYITIGDKKISDNLGLDSSQFRVFEFSPLENKTEYKLNLLDHSSGYYNLHFDFDTGVKNVDSIDKENVRDAFQKSNDLTLTIKVDNGIKSEKTYNISDLFSDKIKNYDCSFYLDSHVKYITLSINLDELVLDKYPKALPVINASNISVKYDRIEALLRTDEAEFLKKEYILSTNYECFSVTFPWFCDDIEYNCTFSENIIKLKGQDSIIITLKYPSKLGFHSPSKSDALNDNYFYINRNEFSSETIYPAGTYVITRKTGEIEIREIEFISYLNKAEINSNTFLVTFPWFGTSLDVTRQTTLLSTGSIYNNNYLLLTPNTSSSGTTKSKQYEFVLERDCLIQPTIGYSDNAVVTFTKGDKNLSLAASSIQSNKYLFLSKGSWTITSNAEVRIYSVLCTEYYSCELWCPQEHYALKYDSNGNISSINRGYINISFSGFALQRQQTSYYVLSKNNSSEETEEKTTNTVLTISGNQEHIITLDVKIRSVVSFNPEKNSFANYRLKGSTKETGQGTYLTGEFKSSKGNPISLIFEPGTYELVYIDDNPDNYLCSISTQALILNKEDAKTVTNNFNVEEIQKELEKNIGTSLYNSLNNSLRNYVDLYSKQTIGGQKTFSESVSAPAFYETSDERLKNFIQDINIKASDLAKIPIKTFEYKNIKGVTYVGTSAQEVEKIYPELVHTNDLGYKSVDYAKLAFLAIGGIKELNDRISVLENKLKNNENI